jgi:hypothetical protein
MRTQACYPGFRFAHPGYLLLADRDQLDEGQVVGRKLVVALRPDDIGLIQPSPAKVAFGAKRTSTGRQNRLARSKMTRMYGPAVRCKRTSSSWRMCGLASMYPASDWSILCSGPSWISARVRSHYRIGLEQPFGSPVFARAREDRSSISFCPLADLGRLRGFD